MSLKALFTKEIIGAVVKRVVNKDKPVSKGNVATAGGVGLAVYATDLVSSGDPTMQLVGGVLYVIAAGLTLYKEKDK